MQTGLTHAAEHWRAAANPATSRGRAGDPSYLQGPHHDRLSIPYAGSQIAASGYDLQSQALAVRFLRGNKVYHYKNAPETRADGLAAADLEGSAFPCTSAMAGMPSKLC